MAWTDETKRSEAMFNGFIKFSGYSILVIAVALLALFALFT